MEFRLLGRTEVLGPDGPVLLPSGRGRALLAILALQAGQPIAIDRLIDELWTGSPPPTAATVVYGLVSRLRRSLAAAHPSGATLLTTTGRAYELTVAPDRVDALLFERLLQRAEGKEPATVDSLLTQALSLWRGPALADFLYEPFAQRTIRALEELRVQAAENLLDAQLALGRVDHVIPRARELLAMHPFRERLHGLLMSALYMAGRQADALAAYESARELLREELGILPGPDLRSLHQAILRQDGALAHASTRPTAGPLRRPAVLPRERRRVTVAVVELSPADDGSHDPEALVRAGAEAGAAAATVLSSHGGRVERSLGDELIAFFGFPVSHEDDADRALEAVADLRTQIGSDASKSGVLRSMRAGVETGEIVITGPAGSLPDLVAGPVISAARRLALAGSEQDIVVGPATVRSLSGAQLEPLPDAAGWVLTQLSPRLARPLIPGPSLVGRERELGQLRAAFSQAQRTGTRVRVDIVGDAGIGKSRLAHEAVASLGSHVQALTIRCLPVSDAVGFYPIRQAVVEAAGLHGWRTLHSLLAASGHEALETVASAVALRAPPTDAESLALPLNHLLRALSQRGPVVVILDDLHWADPSFVALTERLETGSGFLVLCLMRPEPPDDSVPHRHQTLRLGPLSDAEVAQLVIEAGGPVAPAALGRVVQLAQGNPLFAGQLLAAAGEQSVEAVPASLVGLLTMRLDQLGPGERDVLRCASTLGLDLDPEDLRALLPPEARGFLAHHLATLERQRFLERSPEGGLRFAHVLLQLAAYQSLTAEDRELLGRRNPAHVRP